jgi:hypothetical protein
MPRWLVLLVIAGTTWVALTIYSQGVERAFGGVLADLGLPRWEPAANHPASDRPEDAFQRAWNKSEQRVEQGMAKESRGR